LSFKKTVNYPADQLSIEDDGEVLELSMPLYETREIFADVSLLKLASCLYMWQCGFV